MSVYNTLQFQPMLITEVLDEVYSSRSWYDKIRLIDGGQEQYPYISRTSLNNGMDALCGRQEKDPEPGNCLTIALDTQVVAYQPAAFYTSQNIQVLRHKSLNASNGIVLARLIGHQIEKFTWGSNGATLGRLKRTRILVPVRLDSSGQEVVDWTAMTQLGREVLGSTAVRAAQSINPATDPEPIPTLAFEPLFVTDIFAEYRQAPSWMNANQLAPGKPEVPYVTNTAMNNGVSGLVARQAVEPNPGNAITIGIDTQAVAYQPAPFYGATKVFELRSPHLNASNAIVLVSSLRRALEKFSWANKASAARLRKTRVMIPTITGADGSKSVDWDGMTQYGRAIRQQLEHRVQLPLAQFTQD